MWNELEVIDELDRIERLDGDFDVIELWSDGNERCRTVPAYDWPSLSDTDF